MTSAAQLTSMLRSARLIASSEHALQQSLDDILSFAGEVFEREARLSPGNRIDFLVDGGIGIEAKVKYGRRAIYRQLARYAAEQAITSIVLVTGTALGLPASINGKPIFMVSIGRTAL